MRTAKPRNFELIALSFASLLVSRRSRSHLQREDSALADQKPLFLSEVARPEQLIPYLISCPPAGKSDGRPPDLRPGSGAQRALPNVGAIGRLRVGDKPLFTQGQVARLKPMLAARTIAEYRSSSSCGSPLPAGVLCGPCVLANSRLHWRASDSADSAFADRHGLALMVSLRDPLRDTLASPITRSRW